VATGASVELSSASRTTVGAGSASPVDGAAREKGEEQQEVGAPSIRLRGDDHGVPPRRTPPDPATVGSSLPRRGRRRLFLASSSPAWLRFGNLGGRQSPRELEQLAAVPWRLSSSPYLKLLLGNVATSPPHGGATSFPWRCDFLLPCRSTPATRASGGGWRIRKREREGQRARRREGGRAGAEER
jgi:hypothetical protein